MNSLFAQLTPETFCVSSYLTFSKSCLGKP